LVFQSGRVYEVKIKYHCSIQGTLRANKAEAIMLRCGVFMRENERASKEGAMGRISSWLFIAALVLR
jgi:hypothetical protein